MLSPSGPAPDVSVCIANWNCQDLLRNCLFALRESAGVRLEVIVVDNASTDGAADMVADDFPEVCLVRNPMNRGFARASNQAAQLARGQYLLFLNNDTEVPPDAIARLVAYATTHPNVGMIGPRLQGADGRTQISFRPRPTAATLLHRTTLLRWTGQLRGAYRQYRRAAVPDTDRTRCVPTLMGAAVLLPRDFFFAIGGWDEDYTFGGEDFDLSTRVASRRPVVYFPEVSILHLSRASTRANVSYSAPNVAIGFARYLRKSGGTRRELWLYKTLIMADAPLALGEKTVQWLWRRLSGQKKKAQQSAQRVKEMWYFLTRGLLAFWQV
ncbi:glycosyl transferase family 2 [Planctomycetaceae bacterium SCGC AG-212-F19]|nr:glycosyl transferase family 2 [Planctomycetaceae bacterium SCGC AG-212-F19]